MEESHMAVGVACPGGDYRGTGYVYLETTNVTFVGVPPDGLAGGISIRSTPLVIPAGSGTKPYGACSQTKYLHSLYTSLEETYEPLLKDVESRRAELEGLAASGNIGAYNQRVASYNSLVTRLKLTAEVHNYILNHQYDRKGTYTWVQLHSAGL
jgi:hypothetical protein